MSAMTWNYRVLRRTRHTSIPQYVLIEAYYDDEGNIVAWCDAGETIGDDLSDLVGEAHQRWEACEKAFMAEPGSRYAALDEDDLPADVEVALS